jgi:hypothetical protein
MGRKLCVRVASDTTTAASDRTTAASESTVIISEITTLFWLATPTQATRRTCSAL